MATDGDGKRNSVDGKTAREQMAVDDEFDGDTDDNGQVDEEETPSSN